MKKFSEDFISKLKNIADNLEISDYRYLLAIILFESGGIHTLENKYGYVGLIQFGRDAIKDCAVWLKKNKKNNSLYNRSSEGISMWFYNSLKDGTQTDLDQLDFVEAYFTLAMKNLKMKDLLSLYMCVLYPAYKNCKDDECIKFSDKAYAANKGLDINKDGMITKKEAGNKVIKIYNQLKNTE